ncbi:hypothetical protein TNCV_4726961 [Trichonephila clavipes]|nr:hypothetical protein TNCV_4726961 [Trichonephila clavipes]
MPPDRQRGLQNSSKQRAKGRLSLAVALRVKQVTVQRSLFHSNFDGGHPRVGQGPPASVLFPPTSREDFNLDGLLKVLPCSKDTIYLTLYAFSGIRAQALQQSSQLGEPLYRMGDKQNRNIVLIRKHFKIS